MQRIFDGSIDDRDLVWHRDENERHIKVLLGSGWNFQFDNHLPFELLQDMEFTIPCMMYHRIIKGKGNIQQLPLIVNITEGDIS